MVGHEQFLEYCRSMKPPYQCPIPLCGRVYKSYTGIHTHMTTFDHANMPTTLAASSTPGHGPGTGRKKGQKRSASPLLGQLITGGEPEPPPVPFSTDMKNVDFELDGKPMRISVYDPIEMLSKEEYEASLPPVVDEPPVPEAANTPAPAKQTSKTPAHKTPKNRNTACDIQRYTIEDKRSKGLPEASFTIIDDYYDMLPDAPPMTDEYYKFVEKTNSELAAEVEYDLDEEDCAWLDLINNERNIGRLQPVDLPHLQLLMDRLEKESFFQAESSGRGDSGIAPIDEDAVCCICMDGECQNSNVILFCDMCNLAVHQECYGVPYIPEGQWLCRRCLQSPSRAVDCALCPNKGGAFKQTDDSRWAHVVCAMWIPEVCFANTVFLEPIDSIGNIPAARWKLTCYICKQRGVGACIQCNKANCYTAFHVTCAQQASLHMKIDAIRETSTAGTSVTVRKAAYCDLHTPHDAEQCEEGDGIGASKRAAEAKAASRQKMKKARKILAEKRSAAPLVALPTIPPDRIQELASLVQGVPRISQFMEKLLAFWTLKRQSRNGVPLLRRLTNAHSSRRNNSAHNTSNSSGAPNDSLNAADGDKKKKKKKGSAAAGGDQSGDREQQQASPERQAAGGASDGGGGEGNTDRASTPAPSGRNTPTSAAGGGRAGTNPKKKRKLIGDVLDPANKSTAAGNKKKLNSRPGSRASDSRPGSRCASPFYDMAALISEVQYWQRLRQDLEKARLLCELISKREREKKKLVAVYCELRRVQLSPQVALQLRVLEQLTEKDVNHIFADPVDLEEVKDYSDVVTLPMDLSTMRHKIESHQYRNIDAMEIDFELMINNCLAYNSKETIFYKAALKLRDQGGSILQHARRSSQLTGFDENSGLLLPHRPKPPPHFTDAAIISKVDGYLESITDSFASDENTLREMLHLTYQLRHHIQRNTRLRAIRRHLSAVQDTDDASAPHTTEDEDDDENVPGVASSAAKQLTDDAGNLTAATKHLTAGSKHLTAGSKHLTSGSKHLTSGGKHLTDDGKHLTAGSKHLTDDAKHLTAGSKHRTDDNSSKSHATVSLTTDVAHCLDASVDTSIAEISSKIPTPESCDSRTKNSSSVLKKSSKVISSTVHQKVNAKSSLKDDNNKNSIKSSVAKETIAESTENSAVDGEKLEESNVKAENIANKTDSNNTFSPVDKGNNNISKDKSDNESNVAVSDVAPPSKRGGWRGRGRRGAGFRGAQTAESNQKRIDTFFKKLTKDDETCPASDQENAGASTTLPSSNVPSGKILDNANTSDIPSVSSLSPKATVDPKEKTAGSASSLYLKNTTDKITASAASSLLSLIEATATNAGAAQPPPAIAKAAAAITPREDVSSPPPPSPPAAPRKRGRPPKKKRGGGVEHRDNETTSNRIAREDPFILPTTPDIPESTPSIGINTDAAATVNSSINSTPNTSTVTSIRRTVATDTLLAISPVNSSANTTETFTTDANTIVSSLAIAAPIPANDAYAPCSLVADAPMTESFSDAPLSYNGVPGPLLDAPPAVAGGSGGLGGLLGLREGGSSAPHPPKESFMFYRTGGEKAPETDEETHSESTSSLSDSDDDSCSESDSDGVGGPSMAGPGGVESESSGVGEAGEGGGGGQEMQLEPLDLVWAKCRGYPWYPALIINPKMPRTGYFHNHVPIPVPPQEVLDLAHTCPLTHQYLVLFFDSKRTWQWLPRGKLEPLGERPALDKAKLVESRKPTDRKAVKRAYEQAILHRCRVTGDHDGLTGESEDEHLAAAPAAVEGVVVADPLPAAAAPLVVPP